ncbi:uncharacterized protein LOC110692561 [Chenopodium quinoa]|uniref:uncharacterized protein LOC110692561 n=1 Tax=Chenopodium quinoa TaxID=63459 RepID=UPI000B79252A|nr:uncharacterized protein LOC110692561 [Chenopodium quinoa]
MRIANWEVDKILIDGGSSANIIYISAFNELKLDRKDLKRVNYEVTGFNGSRLTPKGIIELSVRVGERSRRRDVQAEFLVINSPSPYNVIMGRPLIHKIGGVVSTYHLAMAYTNNEGWLAKLSGSQKTTQQCYITALKQPAKTRQQSGSERRLPEKRERKSRKRKREEYHKEKHKQKLAMENFEPAKEEMARPLPSGEHVTVELTEDEMPEIDPAVMVHRLNVKEDIRIVRQKKRSFSAEKNQAIQEEVENLMEAGFVEPRDYPEWLANVVMVKKANGQRRMCVDFTDLNKACSKDC